MQARQNLRKQYRQYRRELNQEQQNQAALNALETALANKLLVRNNKIACYLANDGELNLMPLIEKAWSLDIEVYLPVLHPFTPGHLLFLSYAKTSVMTHNHYGIVEPKLDIRSLIRPQQLDSIFVPLVAFDSSGNRLGMGGGFYDRTLASVINRDYAPQLIGVAHDGQQADSLPFQTWDIPMQAILTPSLVLKIENKNS
ncbi:5-formyltetrahydrofolate cyclo-ligase [Alteromonadaceae bacterium M269]|nr:5-formyltetrahydrofolate cyclo-ligase [Alteromonadaceae bacterium M269]